MYCTGSESYALKNGESLDFSGGPVVKNPPMQGKQVQSLLQEDSTCLATKPKCHNC